jgi:peptidoglycan/xylan/chitin deacetylase (PgdA/CDA1 family)
MRTLASRALFGAAILLRRTFQARRATLLNYHRFPDSSAASFRRQCEYLQKSCRVISMTQLAALLRAREPLPPHAVVITVDDGRRDFYTCAYPILREFGFPAIMYLPTAFMDGEWLWFDRFRYLFEHTALKEISIAGIPPVVETTLDLCSAAARDHSFHVVARQVQWLPAQERDQAALRMADLLRVELPARPPAEFAPLAWSEARKMAAHGIEFGGHTVNHPILQTLRDRDALEREISGCKARIEQELPGQTAHFAYPSGNRKEVPAMAREVVLATGFQTAAGTKNGQATLETDCYWLPRTGADPWDDLPYFRRCAAAVRGA